MILLSSLRTGFRWPLLVLLLALQIAIFFGEPSVRADSLKAVVIAEISGTINPAADDYLKTALKKAAEQQAKLFILKLNTPGGMLPSMQSMVEALLQSPVPTVVYVTPKGGGATSAGVFITLAGNFAVMTPGTTIGAAHPVMGGGENIQGDMREKVENYAVSLGRAIAEQRGRNVQWVEQAVRESVSITDRDAVTEKVIDFSASDVDQILRELEGKTVTIGGAPVTLQGLADAPREPIEMNLRQQVANFLADPNVAMLLGLGAMLGIGIELYHPGAVLPGVVGATCLVLSLIAGQVIPINTGGLLLLLLSAAFFVAEMFMPSFGALGVAGIICLVLGSIYFVDTDEIWSTSGFRVQRGLIGTLAGFTGGILFLVSSVALRAQSGKVQTGREGLADREAVVVKEFTDEPDGEFAVGKVRVMGEIWQARLKKAAFSSLPKSGDIVVVQAAEGGLRLLVKPKE
ncbi:MAG: nodulation protein NfeD [Bdellovibrionota bacterium]